MYLLISGLRFNMDIVSNNLGLFFTFEINLPISGFVDINELIVFVSDTISGLKLFLSPIKMLCKIPFAGIGNIGKISDIAKNEIPIIKFV